MNLRFVYCLALLACLFTARDVYAQTEVPVELIPEAVTSDLRFTVTRWAASGRLTEALPHLDELIRRFEAARGERFEQELERFYFMAAAALIQLEDYDEAVLLLQKHTSKFPNATDAVIAWEWLGDCYGMQEDFTRAAQAYRQLRARYNLRGPELEAIAAKEANALVRLARWDDAVPLLNQLLQARDPALRGQAATLLVRAYLALDQVAEIVRLLPQLLTVSQARYDIDFNVMLIFGGDAKYHAEDYENALLLYQLALTKEELLAWHDEQIALHEDTLRTRQAELDVRAMTTLRTRLRELREARIDLVRRDSFTEELLFRKGQTLFELNRKWEAFWTFWSIWKTLPGGDLTRQALFSAYVLAGELLMDERAIAFGYTFMDSFGPGDYFDEVTLQLANLHLRNKQYTEAIAISDRARKMNPDHAFIDRLVFITGYSLFQQGELASALAAFHEVRENHRDSESEEGALYWIGMTHLFRAEYPEARDEFSEFTARFLGGMYVEDARFRLAVTEYGLSDFDASRELFERFLETYPLSVLRAEAHAFLGDIAGAQGRLEDALTNYRLVSRYTGDMPQINYAAFQIGKILELQSRFADMAEFFAAYLQTYRLDGQYTEALHRLGFARKMMGDVDGMLRTYEDAIRRYGHRIDALGIDLIIRDWVVAFRSVRGESPLEWIRKEYSDAVERRAEPLRLRLEWALSDLCGEPAPAGLEQLDLRQASPAVLEWLGRVLATSHPEIARTALEKAVEEFPDNPWMEEALSSWADLEAKAGLHSRALALYERIFELFPMGLRAGAALKNAADMKVLLRQFDAAMQDYLRVLEVREWRGPLWPESLFKVGAILLDQGKLQEAFGYFQRVYVLYEGYPEWAARAYLNSGIVLERLNRRREARETYQELLNRETLRNTEAVREARTRLEALL